MERSDLVEVARRMIAYARTGTTATHAEGPRRNPIRTYTDPAQFELEKERIFGQSPQLICFSSDLPGPGDYRTHDDLGIPIVVVRTASGEVRAFLNSCAHRAMRVAEGEGRGIRNFQCPYHAWTYDLDGRLTGIHKANTFGKVDASCYGLTPLPCREKYGLVYVSPRPELEFEIDDHLGALGPELGSWGLEKASFIEEGVWDLASNWKLALDTFCEGYHFGPLHPETIAPVAMTNTMTYDRYGVEGEHHRLGFPLKSLLDLADKPEAEWGDPHAHFNFVYFIFPNISMLVSPGEVEFFQLYPGASVGEHRTRYRAYTRRTPENDEARDAAREHFRFIFEVVDREDYRVSAAVQRNFSTGLQSHTTFGSNEPSLINMHRTFRRRAGLPLVDEPAPE